MIEHKACETKLRKATDRLQRTIKILKLKLVIARQDWDLGEGFGDCAARAERLTKEAEAVLKRMKLTQREQEL